MKRIVGTVMVIAILTFSGLRLAHAQPAEPAVVSSPPGPTAPTSPDRVGFVAIDRIDGSSRAGIELSSVSFGLLGDNIRTVRAEGHARYVDNATGLGGYVQLPFAYAQDSHGDQRETITDVGDLEIGGIFVPRLGTPDFGLIFHAGVTLPTGEHGATESVIGELAGGATLRDFSNSLPGATTLKLGASPVFRKGMAFARLDLGLDWNIDQDQQSSSNMVSAAIHFNAGVGVDFGQAALMLESENASILSKSPMGSTDSITLDGLAISARVNAGKASPYAAMVIPLDHDLDTFSAAFIVGVDLKL
ncbi:MAG TPA: hypothetical protein VH165_22370 [Kofleriaceae bacterium]|jgi:hypothetical protein|nr:hypothetical protein [Kofleriaceae bacterium]